MKCLSPSYSCFEFQNCTKTKKDVYLRYLSANCGSRPIMRRLALFTGPSSTFYVVVTWAKTIGYYKNNGSLIF